MKVNGLESRVGDCDIGFVVDHRHKITKAMPSMEFVITWVRKKTRQGFIHYIWDKLKQGDFLGTGRITDQQKKYWDYKKARDFVHALKLKDESEWYSYCKSEKKPSEIPQ